METTKQKENSGQTLAIILIVIGAVWILGKIGISLSLHSIVSDIVFSFRNIFHAIPSFIFSWPMILIIVGLILMAGNRNSGIVLIIIGGILLLPKIFLFPGITISLLIPAILVGVGVSMILKHVN
jgi:predicted membrane protein